MPQSVDPNRVIQKLALRIANDAVQAAMNEVALEDANAAISQQEMPTAQHEG